MQNKKSPNKNSGMVYGIRPTLELLESGKEIDRVFLLRDSGNDQLIRLQKALRERNVPTARVPQAKLDRLTRKHHQGVVAFVSAVNFAPLEYVVANAFSEGRDPFVLVLDQITDVRNFGGIARSAECAGADCVVVPQKGGAQVGGDAMRTSAGALNHLPVCREQSLTKTIRYLQESGLKVVACTEHSSQSIFEENLTGPIALLMGSEDTGISPELLKITDVQCGIPMGGKVASLNVSVATGIALFEMVRQRRAGQEKA